MARTPFPSRTCEHCGGTFTLRRKIGRFCKRACVDAAQSKKVALVCETCGTSFERKRSLVRARTFCSRICDLTKNAQPIVMSEDGLTARVPLVARNGSIRDYALIDATDAAWAGQWTWNLNAKGYASRGQGILLHRELLGLVKGDGLNGDHINKNRLDDRRSNLRPATDEESTQNVPGRPGTSKYRGVALYPKTGKWVAYCNVGGKRCHLGYFDNEEVAAEAARNARKNLMPFAVD